MLLSALKSSLKILNILITNLIFPLRFPAVLTLYALHVQSFLDYLSHQGLSDGPLFQMVDGHPLSRKTFSDFLSLVFRSCSLDSSKYKGHSFRIGAATFR